MDYKNLYARVDDKTGKDNYLFYLTGKFDSQHYAGDIIFILGPSGHQTAGTISAPIKYSRKLKDHEIIAYRMLGYI